MASLAEPKFFESANEFADWLDRNHRAAPGVVVGFYKAGAGRPTLTWSDAVDAALCYGWIDGVRKGLDADSYQIRFTPRKPGSKWSALNLKKAAALAKAGRLKPAGLAAYEARAAPAAYSYQEGTVDVFTGAEEKAFRAEARAWKDWQARAPSYRKAVIHWVTGAKRPETRASRFGLLLRCSAAGQLVPMMRYGNRK